MPAKKQRIRTRAGNPKPPPTHLALDSVRFLGMTDGVPQTMMVSVQTGNMQGQEFVIEDLQGPIGPIDCGPLVAKDPALFKRLGELLTEAIAEELGETAEIEE